VWHTLWVPTTESPISSTSPTWLAAYQHCELVTLAHSLLSPIIIIISIIMKLFCFLFFFYFCFCYVTVPLSALIRLHNTLMLVSCLSWQTEKLLQLEKLENSLACKTLLCRMRKKIKKILIVLNARIVFFFFFCLYSFLCFCFFLCYLRQCTLKLYEPDPWSSRPPIPSLSCHLLK